MVVLTAFGVVLQTAPKTAAEPGTTVSMTTIPLSYSGTVANGATVNIPLTVPATEVTLSATEEGTWKLSTPGGSISTDSGRSFEFSANLVGDYSVTFSSLQREVGSGWSATIVVALPSQNQPPVANAGPDQTVAINTKVTLDGTSSTDPNNLPLTYAWSIQSAPARSTATLSSTTAAEPTFTPDVAGQYVFALNVTDNLGLQSATFATVTITATNIAPTIDTLTVTPAAVAINTPVTASAAFTDPDVGQSHTVTFDWGDGSTPTAVALAAGTMQASAEHTYTTASTYTVTCAVADNGKPPLTATHTAVITAYMPQLTDLQIAATPNPARVDQPVTVQATVDNPSGVSGKLAYSWSLVTPSGSAVPTPSGGQTTGTGPFTLTFTFTPDVAGQYNAQVRVQWDTLAPLTSSTASVTVSKIPTQLSATATPTVVAITKPFTIAGTLSTTANTPIAGATIQLQKLDANGNWQGVSGKTCTTATTGAYTISTSEPLANTYQYRTTFAGSDTYAGITSNSVSVKVVSKASVLQDLATLTTTINKLPNSAFIPGTKNLLLAELSLTELQVKFNVYGGTATTLQKLVLPRMDGCATTPTGTPDGNDWVRTSTAQSQLYPQVQNLIQELQALQGSQRGFR